MLYVKRNLPVWERALRLCLAVFIGFSANYFLVVGVSQILVFITGAILAGTSIIGFCPACAMLGRKSIGLNQ